MRTRCMMERAELIDQDLLKLGDPMNDKMGQS